MPVQIDSLKPHGKNPRKIAKAGARMYKGKKITRASGADSGTSGNQPEGGGSSPTPALHLRGGEKE